MDHLRRGTWIINTTKHLNRFAPDAEELTYFDQTHLAGKAGSLLATLAADNVEVVSGEKLRAYASAAKIRASEIEAVVRILKEQGRVDYTTDDRGRPNAVEVFSFSTRDAIETTSKALDSLDPTPEERGATEALEATFMMPRYKSELLDTLSAVGISDEHAELSLKLQKSLDLVKVASLGKEAIFYNEYSFTENPDKSVRAIASLESDQRQVVLDVQAVLHQRPGLLVRDLTANYGDKTIEMMEGIGLLDTMLVRSPYSEEAFATLPQMRGEAIGLPSVSADVFHKAKTLLNCLRFGQYISNPSRGRIVDDEMLLAIVRKLVRGEELKPSTAAGQDYRILEREGVIETTPAGNGMYTMRLRQREVGTMVLAILQQQRAMPEFAGAVDSQWTALPSDRTIPEHTRSVALAKQPGEVPEATMNVLASIRTGGRG